MLAEIPAYFDSRCAGAGAGAGRAAPRVNRAAAMLLAPFLTSGAGGFGEGGTERGYLLAQFVSLVRDPFMLVWIHAEGGDYCAHVHSLLFHGYPFDLEAHRY